MPGAPCLGVRPTFVFPRQVASEWSTWRKITGWNLRIPAGVQSWQRRKFADVGRARPYQEVPQSGSGRSCDLFRTPRPDNRLPRAEWFRQIHHRQNARRPSLATSGQILWNGADIRNDLIGFKRVLGYVPEEAFVYPHLTGLEHLELIGRLRQLPESLVERRASELLRLLWLHEFRYSPISSYSKGMKQRVLIAGALLHDPDLLILDEPSQRARYRVRAPAPRADRGAVAPGQDDPLYFACSRSDRKGLLAGSHAVPGKDRRERRSWTPARPDEPAFAGADLPPTGASGRCE